MNIKREACFMRPFLLDVGGEDEKKEDRPHFFEVTRRQAK
jgi:hypothetical protein